MLAVQRLEWDEWNIAHIARHQVVPAEVEQVCHGLPMTSQTYKGRIRAVGPTSAGRMLTVILAPRGEDIFYAITARPASRKERRRYQEWEESENK
jgi:uncharacterized DUF497 family protein